MVYFASDTHLGLCNNDTIDSRRREKLFVEWLKGLDDCTELYLLGDILDYWFEYSKVVPKGYVRLFAQLASMVEAGVKIYYFAGNHDLWLNNYFKNELGVETRTEDLITTINGKRVLLSHGDALNGQLSLLGRIFRSKFLKAIFERLVHPDLSVRFGMWWSLHNRMSRSIYHTFGGENEKMVMAARKALVTNPNLDYIVCGHIHIPVVYPLNEKTNLVVLGQWVTGVPHYACMDDEGNMYLKEFKCN